jgi:hypothetical protein
MHVNILSTKQWISLLLISAIIICIWVYSPGLNGGFYLDDAPNIEDNVLLNIQSLSFAELWQATWSGQAGHLKRPIPMLSFALNMYFAENDVYAMKITNLVIHIINALLIIYLFKLLLPLISEKYKNNKYTNYLALTVGIIWLLHPFNLTSVLYVVQRMTSLSALFTLVSIICYVTFRKKQLANQGHWVPLIISTCFFGSLALLSKENAVLIPLYLLTIEFFILKFNAHSHRDSLVIKFLFNTAIITVIFFTILLFFLHNNWLTDWYAHRPFTLEQRLLTESRVIVWYARMIIAPDIFHMGLLLDDIELSTSLLKPFATILSIISIIFCVIFIVLFRLRLPIVTFGLTWFLIGHLLESTIVPLEIAYEHRNYLPSIGLLLAFSHTLYLLLQKVRISNNFIAVICASWLSLLIFTTYSRAEHWRSPANLALIDVEHHPNSPRANIYAGQVFVNLAMNASTEEEKIEYASKADASFLKASELDKAGASSAIGRIVIQSIFNKEPDAQYIELTKQKLATRKLDTSTQHALITLTNCQLAKFCNIPHDIYISLIDTMINNDKVPKSYRASLLISKSLYYTDILHEYNAAKSFVKEAISLDPSTVHYRFDLVRIEILTKNYMQALTELQIIKKSDKYKIYSKNIAEWEELITEVST